MVSATSDALAGLANSLQKNNIKVHRDLTTRLLYSTDASLYEIEPLGVVFPKTPDDLNACVELAASYEVPILARGAGSSLAGQAVGAALILDCSRHLTHILEINSETRTATVEPGVIMAALNQETSSYGLQFGPDPASADRATMGGSIVNNATGAHSILFGMAVDHLDWLEVIFGDGSQAHLESITLEQARKRAGFLAGDSDKRILNMDLTREEEFYRTALQIRDQKASIIKQQWPRTWRRASGYNLNYLLPWSPTYPPRWEKMAKGNTLQASYPPIEPGCINLAHLIAGSEGTLGVVRKASVRLVPLEGQSVLGVLTYPSLPEACEAVPALLEKQPSAIELIPRSMIHLARSVPAYARQLSFVKGDPAALLVVEFTGENQDALVKQAKNLGGEATLAVTPEAQANVWNVRKVGLGILSSRPGDRKSIAVIEDIPVPVDRLGEFVRGMLRLFEERGVEADFYAHASAGCLHIRPLLNLKTEQDRKQMRNIASRAVDLSIGLGGGVSGEHGDGLARSEWLGKLYGPEILEAMRGLKRAADPKGLLNPGKVVDPLPMDRNLRFGEGYQVAAWEPIMDFTPQGADTGSRGLARAIEMCNGAGVCRKSEGVMCPSFQATQDEMHSTRGRSNLLRAMISGKFPAGDLAERSVYQALDLCLACKGCKSECPSAVDMAKLKYEFEYQYYQRHSRRLRDYLFAHIDRFARLGQPLAPIVNYLISMDFTGLVAERLFGLSSKRKFPRLSSKSFQMLAEEVACMRLSDTDDPEPVLVLSDAFMEFFYPEVGLSALRALEASGAKPYILPVIGAGRTLISKGMLVQAKKHAMSVVKAIRQIDPDNKMDIIGLEPSEIYTLRDEYPDLLPGDELAAALPRRSWMIDEFLIRPGKDGRTRMDTLMQRRSKDPGARVLLHGHCYQKAQSPTGDGYPTGEEATVSMLKAVGYQVTLINSGCCGMAGAFGYEAEHYQVSKAIGELKLLPTIRAAQGGEIIAASGVSCQSQISDGTEREAIHPIRLVF